MRDPYAFAPTLGEIDLYLAGEGRHEELYEKLGAHVTEIDGATGVAFAVWAPSARSVSVVGDFNSWDGRLHPMRSLGASGIWELFIPGVPEGSRYKFELRAQDGDILLRADPFAFETELPPKTASVVNRTRYEWTDDGWMELRHAGRPAARADVDLRGPPRLLAAEPAGGQPLADLPRAGRRAGRLRDRHGLHPRRAHAGHGPPVQRLVGLPGHLVLRAHTALRHTRPFPGLRRSHARARRRRDPRLGARRTSRATSGRSRASTAARCSSTPIRAAARTRTGAR